MRYQDCAEAAQADDGAFATPAADTSINAATGLSTDYLNHFNEAIMLLDMLRDAPDCRDDFLTWRAKSYREHFAASRVRSRDTAIAAYAAADAHARESLDALAGIMTMMLEATKVAMSGLAPDTAGMLGARRGLPQTPGGARRRGDQRRDRRQTARAASDGRRPAEPLELQPVETRTYPSRPFLAVSAAILRDRKVLVVRRARKPALHLYTLPGGVVEAGESLTEAVIREAREETALTIEPLGLAGYREVVARDGKDKVERHFVILSFAARWLAGEVKLNEELDDARWLAPHDLAGLTTTEGLAEIIAAARALLGA